MCKKLIHYMYQFEWMLDSFVIASNQSYMYDPWPHFTRCIVNTSHYLLPLNNKIVKGLYVLDKNTSEPPICLLFDLFGTNGSFNTPENYFMNTPFIFIAWHANDLFRLFLTAFHSIAFPLALLPKAMITQWEWKISHPSMDTTRMKEEVCSLLPCLTSKWSL